MKIRDDRVVRLSMTPALHVPGYRVIGELETPQGVVYRAVRSDDHRLSYAIYEMPEPDPALDLTDAGWDDADWAPLTARFAVDVVRERIVIAEHERGPTLADIINVSYAQRARLDTPCALQILSCIAATLLDERPTVFNRVAPLSPENVRVSFDGVVDCDVFMPWAAPARVPQRGRALRAHAPYREPELILLGVVAAQLLTGKPEDRAVHDFSLPALEKNIRDDARNLLVMCIEQSSGVKLADVVGRIALLAQRLPCAPADLGYVVRQLFPAEWEEERALREQLEMT